MSQFNPSDPYGQLQYYAPVAPLRPTSVTVLAVIGIVFGGLGLLSALMGLLQAAGLSIGGGNPIVKTMSEDPFLRVWSLVNAMLNLAVGGLLLFGSISALSLKPVGRSCMLAYAWLAIVMLIVSTIISFLFVIPKFTEAIANSSLPPQMKPMMQMMQWASLIFAPLGLIYPGFILWFMTRPHVKTAFGQGQAPNAGS